MAFYSDRVPSYLRTKQNVSLSLVKIVIDLTLPKYQNVSNDAMAMVPSRYYYPSTFHNSMGQKRPKIDKISSVYYSDLPNMY